MHVIGDTLLVVQVRGRGQGAVKVFLYLVSSHEFLHDLADDDVSRANDRVLGDIVINLLLFTFGLDVGILAL